MLHICAAEQQARLAERLGRPDKHWKYNPGDVDERQHWPDYQQAYQVALSRCSTEARAVVRRARRPQVVRQVGGAAAAARSTCAGSTRSGRPPTFDVAAEQARLAAS